MEKGIGTAAGRLLAAILPHVTFDGWSEAAFRAAASETGIAPELARAICPRGALDLAVDRQAEVRRVRRARGAAHRLELADHPLPRGHARAAVGAGLGLGLAWGSCGRRSGCLRLGIDEVALRFHQLVLRVNQRLKGRSLPCAKQGTL